MNILKKILIAIALIASTGVAQATVISGKLNNVGYDVLSFQLSGSTTVDFQNTVGIFDAAFGLFNSAGALLIYADDSVVGTTPSTRPHLTQTLAAGKYSLLITSCCAAIDDDWTYLSTDGVNAGIFYKSTSATLTSVTAALSAFPQLGGAAYQFTATNVVFGTAAAAVPEPGTLALFGISVAAFGLTRRKSRAPGPIRL
ncbi:MAG: PEP-CTERM sorting domain-containing protein [Massilia sp.]